MRFKTKGEIDEYLSHGKIICLECKREFNQLGNHLIQTHFMGVDEYRDKYGLPYSRGLVGTITRDKISNGAVTRIEEGRAEVFDSKKLHEARKLKKNREGKTARIKQPFHDDLRDRMHIGNTKFKRFVGIEDIKLLRKRMLLGRSIHDICNDKDMPSRSSILRFIKRNNEAGKIISLNPVSIPGQDQ